MPPRIVVIGAGAAGLRAAWACAEAGASVTVVEQRHPAAASSGLSAGIVNRQVADRRDRELRSRSMRVLDVLAADGQLDITRAGYLRIARSAEQWTAMQEAVAEADSGVSVAVSTARVAQLVPGMRTDDVHGAMFGPMDGHLDGPQLCAAYLARARSRHAGLITGRAVTEIHPSSADIAVTLDDGQVLLADRVINAAGAWLGAVAELAGMDIPMASQRHDICIAHVPGLGPIPTVQTYVPGSVGDAVYVRPESPGTVLAGLHSYDVSGPPARVDSPLGPVDATSVERVATALADRFPGWTRASLRPGWAGLYPMAVDGSPVIGPHRDDARIVACGGLGGFGLTVSGAVGAMAAQWAMHGECSLVDFAEDYLPDRPALQR